jgi:hypothetical protein
MSRILVCLLASSLLLLAAETPLDPGPQAVVQQLFDAMATRNGDAARAVFAPDAALFSLGGNGKASKMPAEEFIGLLASTKNVWLERIWNPTVLIHGHIAVVWAPYDFHLNGQFSHCGMDSFGLMRTAAGWKITYVSDTRETQGCSSPLGPLK